MVPESQRSRFQKVKAIPARSCIDWNRCSSASRPPLFADGISSKKIMIKVEQILESAMHNALLPDDSLCIFCWTISTRPLLEIFFLAKQKQNHDNQLFDIFMTKLSNQCRIVKVSDNSDTLPRFFISTDLRNNSWLLYLSIEYLQYFDHINISELTICILNFISYQVSYRYVLML